MINKVKNVIEIDNKLLYTVINIDNKGDVNMFYKELIGELMKEGLGGDVIRKVMTCVDNIAVKYSITKAESNVVVYDAHDLNEQYVNLFLQCKEFEGQAAGTLRNKKLTLTRFIKSISCSVLDVTPMMIRVFLSACQTYKDKKKCNSTIEGYKQHLSAFFNWLKLENQIDRNPVANIPTLKLPKEFKGALNPEEVNKIKYACKNIREKLMVEFLVSSGLRISEFVSIKFDEINMEERSVKVMGKGSKERMAYFSSEAKILIEEYRKKAKSIYLYGVGRKDANGEYGKITAKSAREALERICQRVLDQIKLPKVTPHTLRRTFATNLLKKGVPLEIVSKLLGHSNLQTTIRYVEISDTDLQSQHEKFIN